jgi:hypothetical protein
MLLAFTVGQIGPIPSSEGPSIGSLGNLRLPRWLDEGLAVNTEQRLSGGPLRTSGVKELRDSLLDTGTLSAPCWKHCWSCCPPGSWRVNSILQLG